MVSSRDGDGGGVGEGVGGASGGRGLKKEKATPNLFILPPVFRETDKGIYKRFRCGIGTGRRQRAGLLSSFSNQLLHP